MASVSKSLHGVIVLLPPMRLLTSKRLSYGRDTSLTDVDCLSLSVE